MTSLGRLRVRRRLRRLGLEISRLDISVGLSPYRRVDPTAVEEWDEHYAAGHLAHYAGVGESARYSVLTGYLRFIGGTPSVLDVGCGPGILLRYLRGQALDRYVGIDPSPAAIEQARADAPDNARFLVTDTPPTDLGSFDVVVCNEVLYIVPSAATLLDQIAGVLVPSGHVLTSIWRHPGDRGLHRLLDKRFQLIDRVFVRHTDPRGSRERGSEVAWHRLPGAGDS